MRVVVKKIADHDLQLAEIDREFLERATGCASVTIARYVDRHADAGERRAQLARDVGEQLDVQVPYGI